MMSKIFSNKKVARPAGGLATDCFCFYLDGSVHAMNTKPLFGLVYLLGLVEFVDFMYMHA